jgi:malate dehydrogenase (oxaloacetate-decarboxylating)(NADP+)
MELYKNRILNYMEKEALDYHAKGRPGKIEVNPTKETDTQKDLALAYSPGVAAPCLAIEADASKVYEYTTKGNLVAVISNGTAVLGLGDIGPLASKPVMEGKAVLFKIFADIDVFDLELDTKDLEEFIRTVKILSPTFGGINLEDISAPDCFEIEERLKAELNIPIMHDDQHGTAIVSAAALLNALELTGKKIENIKVVINGAGAAATSCASIYLALGLARENLFMFDTKGLIHADRDNLDGRKKMFTYQNCALDASLEEVLVGADMFLGLSKADVLNENMLLSMAKDCIVFALANPNPEISYDIAIQTRPDIIFATGRSDYPNQVNNVLGFPYIFRGALDVRATKINEAMKLAAVHALADLTKMPVPQEVIDIYGGASIEFGRTYILPKPFDNRLLKLVSTAVSNAAIASGVAQLTEIPS